MSIEALMVRTATIELYLPGTSDDFNDETEGYDEPFDSPAWFDQTEALELTTGQETTITYDKVFLPAQTPLTYLSRITSDDGGVYQVNGDPWRVWTPVGEHHVEAKLKKIGNREGVLSS